jgi:hypothetical protein
MMTRLGIAVAPLALVSIVAAGCGSQPDAKSSGTNSIQAQANPTPAPDFVVPGAGRALEHGIVQWNLYNRASGFDVIGRTSTGATVRSFTLEAGPNAVVISDKLTGGKVAALSTSSASNTASVSSPEDGERIRIEFEELSDSAEASQAQPNHAYSCAAYYWAVTGACGSMAACWTTGPENLLCFFPTAGCIAAEQKLRECQNEPPITNCGAFPSCSTVCGPTYIQNPFPDCTCVCQSCVPDQCAPGSCGWQNDPCTGQPIDCGPCNDPSGGCGGCGGGCGGCGCELEMDTCLREGKHHKKKAAAPSTALGQ